MADIPDSMDVLGSASDTGTPSGAPYDPSTESSAPPIPPGGVPTTDTLPSGGTDIPISRQTRASPQGTGSGQGAASATGISDDQDVLGPASPREQATQKVLSESAPNIPQGPLTRSADDTTASAVAKGAGTVGIKGLSHWLGFGGDIGDLADMILAGVRSIGSDKSTAQLMAEQKASHEAMLQRARDEGGVNKFLADLPSLSPPSGADISQWVMKHLGTGEYEPTTKGGQYLMNLGEAGVALMGPGGTKIISPNAGQTGLALAKQVLAQKVKSLPVGVAGAGAGQYVGERFGPGAGLLTSIAVPGATHVGTTAAKKYVGEPFMPKVARQSAGDQMLGYSTGATRTGPDEIVPGSKPTTAEATGDTGLAQLQQGYETGDPAFAAQMHQQRTTQNAARTRLVQSLANPEADPHAVSQAFQQHLDAITAQHDAILARAQQEAERLHSTMPEGGNLDDLGRLQQEIANKQGESLRKQLSALYDSIDPDGTMSLVTQGVQKHAADTLAGMDPAVTKPNAATPMLQKAEQFPEVMPFQKLIQFDQTLTGEIKQAARSGDENGLRQLKDLKGAVKSAINDALDNQHAWEARAVERGDLSQEDTTAARLLKQWQADWYARQLGEADRARAGSDATGRTSGVSSARGATSSTGRQRGNPPSDQGVSAPNFDAEAADKLSLANRGYGKYRELYRSGPVGEALKREAFGNKLKMEGNRAAASAFKSGDGGYQAAQAWLRSARNAEPEMVDNMKTIATERLRQSMKEGPLTPKGLDAWKRKYAGALRALDEKVPGFSKSFDDVAAATETLGQTAETRRQAIADAQKGIAAKFLGAADGAEVQQRIGKILSKPDSSAGEMDSLVSALKDHPEALEGARKGAVDWLLGKHNAGVMADNTPVLSGPKLRTVIEKNEGALRRLFGDEGFENLKNVATDFERSQQLITAQGVTHGSNTAKLRGLVKNLQARGPGHHGAAEGMSALVMISMWEAMQESGFNVHHMIVPVLGAGAWAGARYLTSLVRQRGFRNVNEIVKEALANPEAGRLLMQEALERNGRPKANWLDKARLVFGTQIANEQNEVEDIHKRQAHADGGAVKLDHEEHGARMVRLVSKIRNDLNSTTEPLLGVHDDAIATALQIAREANA